MQNVIRGIFAVVLAVSASACLDDVTGTRPLTLALDPDPTTVEVGQNVTFNFVAEGTGITSVTVEFGDGEFEVNSYPGPVEVTDLIVYAYSSPGTYMAVGRVIDQQGALTDTVEITVDGPT